MAGENPVPKGNVTTALEIKPKARKQASHETANFEISLEDQLLACMNPGHVMFVEHYLVELNATKAYQAAFNPQMRDNVARAAASRLLTSVNVQNLLALRVKVLFERSEGLQDRMLVQQFALAFADPNELVEHRREACRFCYGENYRYQYKPSELEERRAEWEQAVEAAIRDGEEPPKWNPKGGVGYDPRREPLDDCPECFGEGIPRLVMKDTRNLSPAAKALYASAKCSKDGIEIMMHSQQKAREVLLKILKLFDDKAEVILGLVPVEKLDAIYAKAMENARVGRERAQGRQRTVELESK